MHSSASSSATPCIPQAPFISYKWTLYPLSFPPALPQVLYRMRKQKCFRGQSNFPSEQDWAPGSLRAPSLLGTVTVTLGNHSCRWWVPWNPPGRPAAGSPHYAMPGRASSAQGSKTSCPRAIFLSGKQESRPPLTELKKLRLSLLLCLPGTELCPGEGCTGCLWTSWGEEGGRSSRKKGNHRQGGYSQAALCLHRTSRRRPWGLPEPSGVLAINMGTAGMLQTPA